MSTTPAKPRISAIPTPGRSSIPTPGRLRSSSVAGGRPPPADSESINLALAEAIKFNNPLQHASSSKSQGVSSGARTPSVASNIRPKTPSTSLTKTVRRRPESRQSDVFSHTTFEVGDLVRIESLGFEGKLKFLGGIEGKQGYWAGVELSGGFAGKGKNDGSVDGVRYFTCAPRCGVFVSTSKLSPPTVGPGAAVRPTSRASSRASLSGRMTPSMFSSLNYSASNGRVTPSISNGRVTPSVSSGRITPSSSFGFSTPAARVRAPSRTEPLESAIPALHTPSAAAMGKITAGSRASKYIGMTAKQLSAQKSTSPGSASPQSKAQSSSSPARIPSLSSPTRTFGFSSSTQEALNGTPKATRELDSRTPRSIGLGRPPVSTPKGRIPSAVAMPPPSPSQSYVRPNSTLSDKPTTPTFSSASNDTAVDDDTAASLKAIQKNGKSMQDKIQLLLSGKLVQSSDITSPRRTVSEESPKFELRENQETVVVLRDELASIKAQNAALEAKLTSQQASLPSLALQEGYERSLITLKEQEAKIMDQDGRILALLSSIAEKDSASQKLLTEHDAFKEEHHTQRMELETLINDLKAMVQSQVNEISNTVSVINERDNKIAELEERAGNMVKELEDTRRELSDQVDELRQAGQETIALYEEKLSLAETKRYELENTIESLREQIHANVRPPSPNTIVKHASEATQIDNETLREQAYHLQRKIGNLEDLLEEARLSAEREDATMQARVGKYKDNEATLKEDITAVRKETERLRKGEQEARMKVEEVEEALRENTVALENARAEVEVLRAEVADLENQKPNESHINSAETDIMLLRSQLHAVQAAQKKAIENMELAKLDAEERAQSITELQRTVQLMDQEKVALETAFESKDSELSDAREVISELRRALDSKTMDSDRVSLTSTSSTKQDTSATKGEIKGLKHIIQELQQQNSLITNQNKVLESENKILLSETDQLREELKALEENFELSLLREERALDRNEAGEEPGAPSDSKELRDLQAKCDAEIDQLRKRMTEAEKKSARTIHDLNKEVSELESLIEAKIYREDDLEREMERLKEKLSRSKKSSKSSMEGNLLNVRTRPLSEISDGPTASHDHDVDTRTVDQHVCEICEQPGHDIFSCPALKDDSPKSHSAQSQNKSDLFCEDCEGYGHSSSNCPYAQDVF